MASDVGRFDRRKRPGDSTDVFPAVTEDPLTGDLPDVADDVADPEPTADDLDPARSGEKPRHARDDPSVSVRDQAARVATVLGGHAFRAARVLWRHLVALSALSATWLAGQARVRLPQWGRWLQPRAVRMGAATVAGLLLCSSYPLFNWWWAAPIAFALLTWVLTRPRTTVLGGFGYGVLFGAVFYLPLIRWVGILVGPVPLLALVALCAVFPGIFGLAAVVVRRLPGWPIWFAVLWVAQEWLKSTVPFGGFPWGVVAAGQTAGPFLALVRLGSVPLLSLAIVLIGCSAAALVGEIVSWWRTSRHRHPDAEVPDTPPAVMVPALSICLVFFVAAAVWPQVRQSGTGAGNEPSVTAAVVQGNVPRLGLEFNAQRLAVLGNDVRETRHLADDVRAGRAPQPDFVVWPEDASEIDPLLNPDAAQEISVAVEAIKAPILVGTVLDVPGRAPDDPAQTNTVIVWNPTSGPGDRHDKRIVQPFGEYLPWRGFFRHLSGLADWAGYIIPIKGTGVVHAGSAPIGVATCWEVIFDRELRDSVRNGAQVLAVPANNANFNQTMSEQQLAFSKLRAVELDRYAVVASNVGISALVTPDGRELVRTNFFTPAYLDNQIRLKTSMTPAARWGPILQGALVLAAVAILFAAMLHNGWFNDVHRRLSELANKDHPTDDKERRTVSTASDDAERSDEEERRTMSTAGDDAERSDEEERRT